MYQTIELNSRKISHKNKEKRGKKLPRFFCLMASFNELPLF